MPSTTRPRRDRVEDEAVVDDVDGHCSAGGDGALRADDGLNDSTLLHQTS
jgi:hypothetical protein